MINPIKLVFCLALFAAVCALEVFLSKRRAWWPGLVLPLCLLPPVLFVLPNVCLLYTSRGRGLFRGRAPGGDAGGGLAPAGMV